MGEYIVSRWLPPFLWMGIIFLFSSQQDVSPTDEFIVNFLFLKSVHVGIYAGLFFLLFRGFYAISGLSFRSQLMLAGGCALLFAISDEFHQTFVPTRGGKIRDVGIDLIGIFLALLYTKTNLPIVHKWL